MLYPSKVYRDGPSGFVIFSIWSSKQPHMPSLLMEVKINLLASASFQATAENTVKYVLHL